MFSYLSSKKMHGLHFLRVYVSLLFLIVPYTIKADDDLNLEEISVFFNVAGQGSKEVEAVIKNEEAYLSIKDVFDYLKIKNKPSSDLDSISGFFLEADNHYLIDKIQNRIILKDKTYAINPDDLIRTETSLCLKSSVFGKIFGLYCDFDFRSLSVNMNTKLDLPVIRERRQEMMRNNISKLKREIVADTTITRKFSILNIGTFDWSLASTQQDRGLSYTQINLKLGTIIAGGETNILLNYDSPQEPSLKQQHYLWRYVNNDKRFLRQALLGKIPAQSLSSLLAPVVGFQLTNTPTTYRRSFGTYTISDSTEPDWIVELYINNTLIDYVKADASGFFTFQVPLVYGNSVVKLRFYGPWGEERVREQNINIPYNFLPEKEMEYRISAGVLEDGKQSQFSRADFKYGLSKGITVGGGVEYLSTVTSGSTMPFLNASFKLASNMLLTGDYTYGVRGKAILNYRLPSNLLIELNYTNYKKGQTAINQNFLEERKAMISKPFRMHKFSGYSRFTLNQIVYPAAKQTLSDLLLSATVKNISLNLTTYALLMNSDYLNLYSNFALGIRLPSRLTIRPQIQYGYTTKKINEVRFELEKQVFGRGFLNLTYDRNFNYNTQGLGIGFRFDLSFARTSFFARQANNRTFFTQSIRGGAIYDDKTNYFAMNNRVNTGRSGLVIYPFLDINSNNRRDKNEPKITGLKLKLNAGRIQTNVQDTTIQIFDLEPYTNYMIELNPNSFDNIAWQLTDTTYKVTTESNKMKLVEVPVKVVGEVSGTVFSGTQNSLGQGRIIVNIYRKDLTLVGRTISESDGYFSFLGLTPGTYIVSVDKQQLDRLKLKASSIEFTIMQKLDGDVANNIKLVLMPLQP